VEYVNADRVEGRRRAGRPRAISREMLEEAACELFLEQGYPNTSVIDITTRAGVSRATFFNYVNSKADLLWAGIDDAIDAVGARLWPGGEPQGVGLVETTELLVSLTGNLTPGVAVLAIANAEAMQVSEELRLSGAQRQAHVADLLRKPLRVGVSSSLQADVWARALAGALFAALHAWAHEAPGFRPFAETLKEAFDLLVHSD